VSGGSLSQFSVIPRAGNGGVEKEAMASLVSQISVREDTSPTAEASIK